MKRILVSTIGIMMVLAATNVTAQTLEELINTALTSNYQIQIFKNEAQVTSNNNVIGNTGQLPTILLNGTYSNTLNNTEQVFADGTIRQGNNAKNTNLNVSTLVNWTVFDGFRVYAKKDQLSYLEQLGQLNTKFYIEQTVSDIVMVYHQLIYEKQLLKNYQQLLHISSFRLDLEKKRKEIGQGLALNYGQALVDYQSDSIALLGQLNKIQTLKVELNRVLNNNLENELSITDNNDIASTSILEKEVLFNLVTSANSQLEQQRLQEMIAETDLRIAKANRYPMVNVFAGYQYSKSTAAVGFVNSNQSFGPTAGISVSFNLYNGGATNREIKNTAIYNENTVLSKKQVNQNLNAEVLNLYNEFNSINDRIVLAQSNVEAMTNVYKTTEEQLKKGAINGYDFRMTQLTLLNAELVLIQLQFSQKTIEINLNRLSGKILEAYL